MPNFVPRYLLFYFSLILVFINITPTAAKAAYWAKKFGGIAYDQAEAVSHTSDGGFIVAGWTYFSAMVQTISCS
ncbi:hypothetical protein [Thermodesulfatator autotrophicus]|uniref:Uncharacterized protein n=1 Tax=Thermodesulfatator autotrophicus TaxID=1795632 RepID=A0A177EA96_9BACT|nr:hypothetical protein [Thermodesulfatator autotrophicus]OAG28350.1 hypothetical protein TH606_01875 [Thermodesulfatator autotrophicus]